MGIGFTLKLLEWSQSLHTRTNFYSKLVECTWFDSCLYSKYLKWLLWEKNFFFILLFTFFSFFVCFQIYPLFSAPFLWKYYVWIVEGIQIFWVGSKICLGAFKNLFIFGNIPLNYRFGVIFVTVYANVTKLWFIKVFATSKYYLEFIQWQQQHISSNIFNTLNLWQTFKRKLKV